MTRREFVAAAAAVPLAQAAARPNIILILADDLGYGDIGCHGQRHFATPNIDRLAAEGMRFTQFYAGSPVCAPSRCCLMTGMHTGHARVRNNHGLGGVRVPLQAEDRTVAELLREAGYRTGLIGKWGLGEAGTPGIPNDQGFDEFFGFLNQDHALDFYPRHLWNNRTEFFPKGNQGAKQRDYVQDLFTERALKFVETNAGRPFFLYLAYTVPHASSELGRDTGDGFVVPNYGDYASRDWPRQEKGYAAMVAMLDRDVGRILRRLQELGIDGNTLTIFSSDNGPALDSGHTPEFFGSSGGLRGRKGQLYEGGIRVPFLARWPGTIQPGQVVHEPRAFWDFLPTAAELVGARVRTACDGISFAPALLGGSAPAHASLYWEYHAGGFSQAIRRNEWKLIRSQAGVELYNLRADPAEKDDLASAHPNVIGDLLESMARARTESPLYPVKDQNVSFKAN